MISETDHKPGEEIAIAEPVTEAGMSQLFGPTAESMEVHSFNMNDPVESMLYVNAVAGKTEPLADQKDKTIGVLYYYVKTIQFAAGANDTRYAPGEIINGLRMVLVTVDGRSFATTSPTAIKTIAALHKTAIGKKKFNPPVYLHVSEERTRGNFKTQVLTVVPKPQEEIQTK